MTEQVNNRYSHMDFSGGSAVKNPPANAGDMSLVSGSGSSPGEGNGNPLQFSCLENTMDRGAWWVAKPQGCKESDRTEQLYERLPLSLYETYIGFFFLTNKRGQRNDKYY